MLKAMALLDDSLIIRKLFFIGYNLSPEDCKPR